MSSPDTLFLGAVDDRGRLTLERPVDYGRALQRLAGQRVEVVIRKRRAKRSDAQNRWLHGVALNAIAAHCGYERYEREELRYYLLGLFGGTKTTALGQVLPVLGGTSRLDTAQMSAFMEWLPRWAAKELGIVIPLPDEPDTWEAIAADDERCAA